MKVGGGEGCHLTYCTNIHAGESWAEVRQNLHRYLPAVKGAVAPRERFGVGLRLSAAAASALREPSAFAELRELLRAHGLYVFTINGFPYGPFHGTRVKEGVYLPDWSQPERLDYTNLLAELLAALLPDGGGLEGSVSTVPGAFKPRAASAQTVGRIASQIVRHVAYLVQVRSRTGRTIALALEPEPCCLLETIAETVEFFERHLYGPEALQQLASQTGLNRGAAEEALRRHVGVCLDLCHAAVEFEDPAAIVPRLRGAGIRIPKMQISAGLRVTEVTAEAAQALAPFNDEVYLHQVVERTATRLNRYVDLPHALAATPAEPGAREWRIHFHVPIFLEELAPFSSTQAFLRAMLAQQRAEPISPHLEVETYTWDVLPEEYRRQDIVSAVVRELDWVKTQLAGS